MMLDGFPNFGQYIQANFLFEVGKFFGQFLDEVEARVGIFEVARKHLNLCIRQVG